MKNQLAALRDPAEMRPLFIPLRREYYDAFASGDKWEEFRPLGPRWNARTCPPGRRVTLSMGYGIKHRRVGTIWGFRIDNNPHSMPGWSACYPDSLKSAACILIKLDPIS